MSKESNEKPKGPEGIELDSLGKLFPVEAKLDGHPIGAIRDLEKRLKEWTGDSPYIQPTPENYRRFPPEAFKGFSFDELCKFRFSVKKGMHDFAMEKKFEEPEYRLAEKIRSSIWQWGVEEASWNEIADAYNSIKNFTFNQDKNFEIRLDYTTYYNKWGYSEYSGKFLDGVFAFLVYYKGNHVMTLGFSVMKDRKLLIQQVQSAEQKGNRSLFKLPNNRMEFVISRFSEAFPNYELYLVDGESLIEKTFRDYENGLKRSEHYCEEDRRAIAASSDERWKLSLAEHERECEIYKQKIAHLKEDRARIAPFYRNTGRYALGKGREVNGLVHRHVTNAHRAV